MNWRVFQGGFIAGTVLAAYSQSAGATGFVSATDLVAAGLFMGALLEALWTVLRLNYQINMRHRI